MEEAVYNLERITELLDELEGVQLHAVEVMAVYESITRKQNCKLLVFGLGAESPLWCRLNRTGRTAFIEDDPTWFERIKSAHPSIECYLVRFDHNITQWKELLDRPSALEPSLPDSVLHTAWDVIVVDAPAGYKMDEQLPGRMSSIYMASRLISPSGSVFVHDAERPVEAAYCARFLGRNNLVKTAFGRAQLNEYRMTQPRSHVPGHDVSASDNILANTWNRAMYCGYIVLSVEPVILMYTGTFQERPDTVIPPLPRDTRSDVVIEMLSWWMSPSYAERIAERYSRQTDGVHRMIMANTSDENASRIEQGIDGFECNKEIFALEDVFMPRPMIQTCNAIYVSRLEGVKRHHLARQVKHLRLLTNGKGRADFHSGLVNVGQGELDHLDLHETVSARFDSLPLHAVSDEINASACGLALSREEGMMRASTQYLLCGKPVVSTQSRGGRDLYYDDYTAIIVADDEAAVWEAVKDLVTDRRDPAEIRRRTLNRIHAYRYRFARQVSRIRDRFGGDPISPERILHDLFFSERDYKSRYVAGGGSLGERLHRFAYLAGNPDRFRLRSDRFCLKAAGNGYDLATTSDGTSVARLQDSAAWILARLDGTTSVQEVIDELESRFDNEPDLADDTRDAIARFIELGVLDWNWASDAR